jgi:hypothetical protein
MPKRNNDTVLILAAVGIGYFTVLRPLLVTLGIEDSKEEKEKINNDITVSENTLDDSHEKLSDHEGGPNACQKEERP